MIRSLIAASALALTFGITCAGAAWAADDGATSQPAGAIQIPAPPAGKGEVVFFRKQAFTGAAVWFKIRENGVELGKLTPGTYVVAVEDPGDHTFSAATENKDTLKLEVDPGEIYYVEGTVAMGVFIGEANIAPSDQASFDKASKHLRLVTPPAQQASADSSKGGDTGK